MNEFPEWEGVNLPLDNAMIADEPKGGYREDVFGYNRFSGIWGVGNDVVPLASSPHH